MKKLFHSLFVMLLVCGFFIQSCTKDKATENISQAELTFYIQAFDPDLKNFDSVPECIEGEMNYVKFYITKYLNDVPIETVEYESVILHANGETLTKVIKFHIQDEVTYKLTKFLVFSNDSVLLKAAPLPGSLYHDFMTHKLDLKINILAFKKIQISVDVVCYEKLNFPPNDDPPPGTTITGTSFALAYDGTYPDLQSWTLNDFGTNENPAGLPNLNVQGNRWGWAVNITKAGIYTCQLWANAGQCDTIAGDHVGTATIEYIVNAKADNEVFISYQLFSPNVMDLVHTYVSDIKPPESSSPYTGANNHNVDFYPPIPNYNNYIDGSYKVTDGDGDGIWILAHADLVDPYQEQ
ncbi:MAG: hypothetical protein KAH25_03770 [Bacteroidales bacterium]|nr:hypothetical protein [Bacteroidales bacterium]